MPISRPCAANAAAQSHFLIRRRPVASGGLALLVAGALFGCQSPPPEVAAAAPPPPAPAPVPFDEAVLNAANAVFSSAPVDPARHTVVIDPLINGVTGEQTAATRQIQSRITALVTDEYPQFTIAPFTADAVAQKPYVLLGTFTPVNARNQPTGDREAYRFCLVMGDLSSGKAVAKSVTRALPQSINSAPIAAFRDSPVWTDDPNVASYIGTCQATKVGDPIDPTYLAGIATAAIVNQAMDAYDAGRLREALALYRNALGTPAGKQLRVLNGLYVTSARLGERQESTDAFGQLVDFGLETGRFGVKVLFRPGSTGFVENAPVPDAHDMWLSQIALHGAARDGCLEVTGHTSKTGSAALNDSLSLARAHVVQARLIAARPAMRGHVVAAGAGDRFPLIGTGADNASDALDRRVEFRALPSCGRADAPRA